MTYDETQPLTSDNHPETRVCNICGQTIAWEDARSHYLLSGYFGCVNKPKSMQEQNTIVDELIATKPIHQKSLDQAIAEAYENIPSWYSKYIDAIVLLIKGDG